MFPFNLLGGGLGGGLGGFFPIYGILFVINLVWTLFTGGADLDPNTPM
ncbi:MAG TPA: hypothetical protein VJZ71_01345 [Phycisphaerae bacterium]|nr:hypothetical protein [Phycisphaerae bacterium]